MDLEDSSEAAVDEGLYFLDGHSEGKKKKEEIKTELNMIDTKMPRTVVNESWCWKVFNVMS